MKFVEPKRVGKVEGFSPPLIRDIGLNGIAAINRLRQVNHDTVKQIAASMAEVGQINPITVREQEASGYSLVAGHHRLEAAKLLKWNSIQAIIVTSSEIEARLAEIDENLVRGELSPAERAMHIAERKRLYEEQHPETTHGGDRISERASRKLCDLKDRFTADTAKKTGSSERKVQLDASRGEKIEGIQKIVGTSLDKGEELDALAKLPKPKQYELINRAASGEKVSAKPVIKQIVRNEKEQALASRTITESIKKQTQLYGVVYADPPWRFETFSENGMDRSADNHYPTMTIEDIKNLQIPAAEDAVCFLWATVPMLPEGLDVLAAWGFKYKSHAIWAKDRVGTGYWFRNKHEILLVGTKGDIPAPAMGTQIESVIDAPLGRHSQKPDCFAEMIEKLFPETPKIELFCRSPRTGWATEGNEA